MLYKVYIMSFKIVVLNRICNFEYNLYDFDVFKFLQPIKMCRNIKLFFIFDKNNI
jgi:hypothetical protein